VGVDADGRVPYKFLWLIVHFSIFQMSGSLVAQSPTLGSPMAGLLAI
jgi:hypothetical protein